jgi:hypothetical protein
MMGAKRWPLTVLACVLAVGIVAPAAAAATWAEVGDAGQLPATAQRPVSTALGPMPGNALTEITGTIAGTAGADMYRICKLGNSNSSATTAVAPGTLGDPQLFLFNTGGFGLQGNDDIAIADLQAELPPTFFSFGVYYLAISGYNADPVSVGGLIFPDTFPGVVGPTGPGGGSPISDWVGTEGTGTYRITLTGYYFCPSFMG